MFIKKYSEAYFVLKNFLIWRVGILLLAYLATKFIPVFSHNFFGGGYSNYGGNPVFWGHLNFDGEHYLSLAQMGYQPLTYFFFPLYPLIIGFLSFNSSLTTLAMSGIIVSNLSFFLALLGLYKLVKLDFKDNVAKLVIVLLLVFPTSFYFGAFYTESLFLMLAVWGIYFARRKNYIFAALIAAFASATRVVGVILLISIVIEFVVQNIRHLREFKSIVKLFLIVVISSAGLVAYMFFLFRTTGDSLIFLHQVSIYGAQRSSQFVFLPQVVYRYVFKILPVLNYSYFPIIFTTYLEFVCGVLFLVITIFSFGKLRLSYSVYAFLSYLIPTFAGSFSSMPRYVLVIFPAFILAGIYLNKLRRKHQFLLFSGMIILMVIATVMFWRGYWVS